MRLPVDNCIIHDVLLSPNGEDRIVVLQMNEEKFLKMLDKVNPKNIIKYLDMRKIPHRDKVVTKMREPDKKRLHNLYKNLQNQRNIINELKEHNNE